MHIEIHEWVNEFGLSIYLFITSSLRDPILEKTQREQTWSIIYLAPMEEPIPKCVFKRSSMASLRSVSPITGYSSKKDGPQPFLFENMRLQQHSFKQNI